MIDIGNFSAPFFIRRMFYLMKQVIGLVLFMGMLIGLYGKYCLALLGIIAVVSYITLILGSERWFERFFHEPFKLLRKIPAYNTSLKFLYKQQ